MSHHFSPEFTVLPPGKEPVSKKLQRSNDLTNSAKRRETQQLDFDNKQMEWKLNQIKEAMSKEKEDRGKQGYIWKSGVSGKLDSHARNILGRSVSATTGGVNVPRTKRSPTGPKSAPKSKQKVKVLRDEPLDLPQRSTRAKDLIRKLKSDMPSTELKQSSGDFENTKQQEDWIQVALDRNSSECMEMQSDLNGNLPLSSIQAIDPSAIGMYFVKWGRKRLLMAVDGVIRRPKTGWGDEVYFPYVGRTLPEMSMKPEPPLRNVSNNAHNNVVSRPEPSPRKSGGALLQGNFDERENAESFQQALNEWRNNRKENINNPEQQNGHRVPEMSVHVAQSEPRSYEVKFSETSTLSYMEHILLNKHRSSDIPSMPKSLTETVNDCLTGNVVEKDENDIVFTADELDERQRYRKLFMVPQSHEPALKIDEIIDDVITESTDNCIVEESPPDSPMVSARTESSVVIEEVHYDSSHYAARQTSDSVQDFISKNSFVKTKKEHKSFKLENDKSENLLNQAKPVRQNNTPRQSKPRNKSAKLYKSENQKSKKSVEKRTKTSIGHYPKGKNSKETYEKSSLLHEIGKIPINPDAIYHRGLNGFFSSDANNSQKSSLHKNQGGTVELEENSTIATASSIWNPISSIYSPDLSMTTYNEATERKTLKSNYSGAMEDDRTEEEDEKTLDDLEWELASRTGNITSDGRISRLIDEWSNEGSDLDIIDDPGIGSGLSTPDVDRNTLSVATTRYQDEAKLEHDFQNMEQIIMGDISAEYSDDEL